VSKRYSHQVVVELTREMPSRIDMLTHAGRM